MIPARLTFAVLAPVLLALGCVALGWRFGPGFSSRDAGLFATSPVIERRADGTFLTWTYGDAAFFFQPGYSAIDGRLVFSLQGSSSSGDVRGRRGEVRIDGAESLTALETGGAVWWEPDGSYVAIDVVDLAAEGAPPDPGNGPTAPTTCLTLVPQLVVGLAFPGRDTAPHEARTLAEALALRADIDDKDRSHDRDEGARGWFFHGFDDRTLSFFVGRFHVRCDYLGCQDYVVERIIDVPRSADAMRQFDVDRTVALYEVGMRGVRGGMTPEEVKQVLGPPTSTMPEQYFGSFRWRYDDGTTILFWNNVVAGIEGR